LKSATDLLHTAPATVLLNPHAARGRAARLAVPMREWLNSHAPDVRLLQPGSADAARDALRELPVGTRAVLVGGDGTLHQLLPALLERGHALGLVPCGSGNDTARALGLHRLGWRDALAHALAAPTSAMDVGEASADGWCEPFISSFSIGFDAAVTHRALRAPAGLSGMPRYLWATFGELGALRQHRVQVQCDGAPVHGGETLFAAAMNTRSYGSGMPAVPHARIDDGRLDLLLAGRFGHLGTLAMLPLLLAGWHLRHPRVRSLPFEHLAIESDQALPLAADGEPLPSARRLALRVQAGALAVVRG
jgi:diacylglycerol kinase family enzyme